MLWKLITTLALFTSCTTQMDTMRWQLKYMDCEIRFLNCKDMYHECRMNGQKLSECQGMLEECVIYIYGAKGLCKE